MKIIYDWFMENYQTQTIHEKDTIIAPIIGDLVEDLSDGNEELLGIVTKRTISYKEKAIIILVEPSKYN